MLRQHDPWACGENRGQVDLRLVGGERDAVAGDRAAVALPTGRRLRRPLCPCRMAALCPGISHSATVWTGAAPPRGAKPDGGLSGCDRAGRRPDTSGSMPDRGPDLSPAERSID